MRGVMRRSIVVLATYERTGGALRQQVVWAKRRPMMNPLRTAVSIGALCAVSLGLIATLRAAEAVPEITAHDTIRLPSRSLNDHHAVISTLALSPDGRIVFTGGDDHLVHFWDTGTGRLLHRGVGHTDWIKALALSPDGALLASGGNDRQILIWDASNGDLLRKLPAAPQAVFRLAFSPDGQTLAAVGFHDRVTLYDMRSSTARLTLGCTCADIRDVAFSPDGELLAAGGRDGVVRFWNTESGKHMYDLRAASTRIRSIAFSADGATIATAGENAQLRLWQVEQGTEVPLGGRAGKVMSMTFCGADRLATGGADNVIRVWDLGAGKEAYRLIGHEGSITALSWQPHHNMLVSGGYDTTLRLWSLPTAAGPATARLPSDATTE